jgi:hypothetical protein
MKTKDKENKEVSLKRKFTLVGETGSSVLGEATPSANLTSTSIPTPTISYSLGRPTLTPNYPQTGNNILNLIYPSFALILLGLGILFVF